MRGRSADWGAASLADLSLKEALPKAVAAGFAGVYVDAFTYGDGGAAVLAELAAASGETPSLSATGAWPSSRSSARHVKVTDVLTGRTAPCGNALVHPADFQWGAGSTKPNGGLHTRHWRGLRRP